MAQFYQIYLKICRRGAPAKSLEKFAVVGPDFHEDLSKLRCGVAGLVGFGLGLGLGLGFGFGLGLGSGSGWVVGLGLNKSCCVCMPALQGSALGSDE